MLFEYSQANFFHFKFTWLHFNRVIGLRGPIFLKACETFNPISYSLTATISPFWLAKEQ